MELIELDKPNKRVKIKDNKGQVWVNMDDFIISQKCDLLNKKDKSRLGFFFMKSGWIICDKSIANNWSFSIASNQNLLGVLQLLFIGANVVSSTIFFKTITLFGINLPSSFLIFPLTFYALDSISELYGERRARSTIISASIILIILSLIVKLSYLAPSGLSPENNDIYTAVIGRFPESLLNVALSLLTVDSLNVYIFHRIRSFTQTKALWVRCFISTTIAHIVFNISLALISMPTFDYTVDERINLTVTLMACGIIVSTLYLPLTLSTVKLAKKYARYKHSKMIIESKEFL